MKRHFLILAGTALGVLTLSSRLFAFGVVITECYDTQKHEKSAELYGTKSVDALKYSHAVLFPKEGNPVKVHGYFEHLEEYVRPFHLSEGDAFHLGTLPGGPFDSTVVMEEVGLHPDAQKFSARLNAYYHAFPNSPVYRGDVECRLVRTGLSRANLGCSDNRPCLGFKVCCDGVCAYNCF